jgi:hypothetical protein
VAWSLALNEIVSWVEFTNVAVCATPLYVTVEVERKFVPLIVSVCAAAPTVAELGDRLVMVGTGSVVESGTAAVAPPPPQEMEHRAMAMQAVARITTFLWCG